MAIPKTVVTVNQLLEKYSKDDFESIHDTIDMLCSKGIANGCYQDMTILVDILSLLGSFEADIKHLEV